MHQLKLKARLRGISLIDTLVALAILAFAIISIAMLSSTTVENNRLSRRITGGLHLAQAKVEEFRNLDYASIVSGNDGPLTSAGATSGAGALYTRTWIVNADTPTIGIKRIAVNISWPDKSGAGSITVETLAIDE